MRSSGNCRPTAAGPPGWQPTPSRNYDEKIRELYLTAFAREPQQAERERLTSYLKAAKPGDTAASRAAYEDAIWALVNTKEFLFNH